MKRVAALLFLGLALALPVSAFAAPGKYAGAKLVPQAPGSTLLANGSFEAGPSGFMGYRATLALIGGAADGARAVRVSLAGSGTSYSILPAPRPVASTLAGASYSASVLVRSQTPGRQLCLRLREYAGESLVGSSMRCLTATSAWQALEGLSYKALASGHELDVYVFQLQAQPGDSFDIDALRLGGGADTSSPLPPPPPPPSLSPASGLRATTIDHAHIELAWASVAGAARYRLLRGTLLVGETSGLSFTDTLLWPQSRYDYRLEALSETGALLQSQETSGQTALLPATGFPRPFPATSVWNQPVGQTAPHPNSAALSAHLVANARNPNLTLHNFAVSVAEAHPSDPTYSVPCTRYGRCTLGAFGAFPIPLTAQADPSADGHLAVYDPRTQREWDLWQGSFGSAWSASAGAAVSMQGDGTALANTASGNAANFPLLGGLIRPEELLQGEIAHALVFMMPHVSTLGHVCPATHHAGDVADPNALMEGMRIQLDPSLNVEALPLAGWQKTIARALQRYGAYLRDGSGSLAILAENPRSRGYDAWAKIGLAGNSASLAALPWNRVRVLQPPATGC